MIRLSVLYPSGDGSTFDHDYYRDHHIPLVRSTWNPASTEIDRGVDGPNVAAVHFTFPDRDAMNAAMAAEGTAAVMADVGNYTNIAPVLQISEVVESDRG
jgi:uncharacterized protein (TIGR02118 family)